MNHPTVLVLDDDPSIRNTVSKVLGLYDYDVLTAGSAHEAAALAKSHDGPIHLVICDLVLPGLGGREAASVVLAHHPDARVLYTSGYSSADSFRGELERSGRPFLGKPFEVAGLLEAVEKALSQDPG